MLKTAKPKKGEVGVGGDSRARCGESKSDKRRIDDNEVDGNKVDDEGETKVQKSSKSKNSSKSKKTVRSLDFLSPELNKPLPN